MAVGRAALRKRALDLLLVGDVGGNRVEVRMSGASADDAYAGAVVRQQRRDPEPDPARAAGHDRVLAVHAHGDASRARAISRSS